MSMKKLYPALAFLCALLFSEKLRAQCSVTIETQGPSRITCNNDEVTLVAIATGAGTVTYQWSTGQTTRTITAGSATTYTVTITDTAGCTATSSFTVVEDRTPPTLTILAFPETICKGDSATLIVIGAGEHQWQDVAGGSVIRVSPEETTRYVALGRGNNGCVATETFELVVRPLPTANISGTRTVCQNANPPQITFTGSGSTQPYTFTYRVNGGAIQTITTTGANNAVTLDVPTGLLGTLTYELLSVSAADNCQQAQTGAAAITVARGPVLTSRKDTSICSNSSFSYTATSSAANTNFRWMRSFVPGIQNPGAEGSGSDLSETLRNTTDFPLPVYYVFQLTTAGGACETVDSLRVVVNPSPRINALRDTSFCNGSFVVNGLPFTSPTPNAAFTWSVTGDDIGLPATAGSGSLPAFVAKNEQTDAKTARITVTVSAAGCIGSSTASFTITVRPGPALTNRRSRSICTNTEFADTARSTAQSTTFVWSRAAVQGISNPAVTGNTGPVIRETLVNTTSLPIDVFYRLTLSTGGSDCQAVDSIRVTVNPTPVINDIANLTVCNGAFVLNGVPFSSPSPNATFTWSVSGPDIGLPQNRSGSILPFNARNTTTSPVVVTVTVSVKAGADSCAGTSTKSFTITVLPGPALTSTKDTSVCHGGFFRYTATSSAQIPTIFSWRRAAIGGNAEFSGTGPVIEETLRNSSDSPLVAVYLFTLSTGVGCITADSVKVTVNPTPRIRAINDTAFCNSAFVRNGIPFSSPSPGASFSWTNSNPAIGLPSGGRGNIPPFNAQNATGNPITATIRVSVKASADSCAGADEVFTITVRPGPALISTKDTTTCDRAGFSYKARSSAQGTSFSWRRSFVAGISSDSARGSGDTITETLQNGTDQPIAVYYVITLATGGSDCETVDSVRVTVNPTPRINRIIDTTVCNGAFLRDGIPFTSTSPNAAFSWTNSNADIGLPLGGRGNIPPFNARNTTGSPITATIRVSIKASGDSCAGADSVFTITVRPGPAMRNARNRTVCNRTEFADTLRSTAVGTTFFWSRDFHPDISNPAAPMLEDSVIRETLVNTSVDPVDVYYKVRLFTGGNDCETVDSIRVTVYPTPRLVPLSNVEYCNNAIIQPRELKSLTSIAVLTWTADRSVGFGQAGTGNIPAFITSNQTDSAITTTIKVSSTLGTGCIGDSTFFRMTVYPTATLTSVRDTSVCDTIPFRYTPRSSARGTRFTWTRAAVTGIANGNGTGVDVPVDERLDNTTSQPVDVFYVFRLTTGDNCLTTETVKVTVNPTPVIDTLRNRTFCNGVPVSGIPFSSASPNAAFTWTNTNTRIGLPESGAGSIPTFTATNKGTTLDSATIRVFISASPDNCVGLSDSFKIYVIPSPPRPSFTSSNGVVDSLPLGICSQSENINFNVNIPVPGVSYRWSSVSGSPAGFLIRNPLFPNTPVSFFTEGRYEIQVLATDTVSRCTDSVRQVVNIGRESNTNGKEKIFAMQPGNLLVYPDNSLRSYQWGFDPVNRTLADRDFGKPQAIPGQTQQFFVPDGPTIDTARFLYWVMLTNNLNCSTRVYYNGPFANRRVAADVPDNQVVLQVIPNPNTGQFRMALKGNIYGTVEARIYNSLGHAVHQKRFVKTVPEVTEAFDARRLPAGLYFVELQSSDLKKVVTRFVIQH